MSTFSIFLVLIAIVCFLLIVNNGSKPKGGGLSSTIGFSNAGWSSKQLTFRKSTWTLADTNRINIIKFKFHGNIKRYGSKIIDNTETAAPVAPVTPTKYQLQNKT
jgi:preprotein translocase subunit SecG